MDPDQRRRELQAKQKRLLQKRSRWQELYANDLLTIGELREKLGAVTGELHAVDTELERIALTSRLPSSAGEITQYHRREIGRFLELETVTNGDMRRLIDHILVSRDGNIQVFLRKFGDME